MKYQSALFPHFAHFLRFFPVFFREEVSLTPVAVNLMYCAVPIALSTMSYLAQRQSRMIGRVQTMVFNRYEYGYENRCEYGYENRCEYGYENRCEYGYEYGHAILCDQTRSLPSAQSPTSCTCLVVILSPTDV
jgi:hypothetical protein